MNLKNKDNKENRKWARPAVIVGCLLVLALVGAVSVPLLRFAAQPERFRQWIDSLGIWGGLAYMAVVVLQIVLALIPGEPFEIVAGYAFGTWQGTALNLAAATLGSMGVFFLVRRFGKPLVYQFFPPEKVARLRFLHAGPRRELLFLLVFMLPGTPKDLMCYFAGLTDIRVPVWLLICSFGRIPSVITSTVGGDALGEKNYLFAGIVFVAALAISGAGLLIFHWLCGKKNRGGDRA